jgi:pyruvate/2-oxoglutarate dehydrogenase complex dihydrolipoamide acyltransferase (E2) component
MEIETPADGVLVKSAQVGDELKEGAVLGMIGAEDEIRAPRHPPGA